MSHSLKWLLKRATRKQLQQSKTTKTSFRVRTTARGQRMCCYTFSCISRPLPLHVYLLGCDLAPPVSCGLRHFLHPAVFFLFIFIFRRILISCCRLLSCWRYLALSPSVPNHPSNTLASLNWSLYSLASLLNLPPAYNQYSFASSASPLFYCIRVEVF